MAWLLTSCRVNLFAEFVDLKADLLLLLIPRHGLGLHGREVGHVDSSPADVGVGPDVGEAWSCGGDDVWVLEHVHWLHRGHWVEWLGNLCLWGSLLEWLECL